MAEQEFAGPGFLADYHVHTRRCGHARGTLEQYVERALSLGLRELGFSDHLPMPGRDDPTLTMPLAELPSYVDEVVALRDAYPDITIRLGIEADYVRGQEEWLSKVLNDYPFDYVLGSVHFVDGWGFDDSRHLSGWLKRAPEKVYADYYALVIEAVESGFFDILAHPDLVKKFAFSADGAGEKWYVSLVLALREAGMAVEISSAGLRKTVGEAYPARALLELLSNAEIGFVLGSDAHRPQDVGRSFNYLLKWLATCGGGEIVGFAGRRRFRLTEVGGTR